MWKSKNVFQPCGGKGAKLIQLPILLALLFLPVVSPVEQLVTAKCSAQSPTYCPSPEVRFGFGVLGDITQYNVTQLHAGWYVNWGTLSNLVHPDGLEFMHIIRVKGSTYSPNKATLRPIIENNLGSTWLIGNEPDCIWQDNSTPDQYAQVYHELYTFLKETDPSCQVAIGGIVQPTPLRLQWLNMVLAAYQSRYGEQIPVDVWNIHNFILQELKGSWGCEIPPGVNATQGRLYSVQDHDNMTYFKQHIVDFRQWMKDHGEQNKPLIISEYGILMPCKPTWYFGFCDDRVKNFMLATFNYFMGAKSSSLGYPADENRLVQRWAWYSLNDDKFEATDTHSNLFKPSTKQITVVGQAYGNYTASLDTNPYVDLMPTVFSAVPSQPLFYDEPMTITLGAAVTNRGNTDTSQDFKVSFWDGDPAGGLKIVKRIVPGLSAKWGQAATDPIEWSTIITEPRRVYVWCDSEDEVFELYREDNNQAYKIFFVELSPSSIGFDPPVPFAPPGQSVTVTVEATVSNKGEMGARNVQVGFWNGDPDSGGTPIGSNTLATISAGSTAQTQIDWPSVEGGKYEVYVKVDSDDAIMESEEANNKGYETLLVAKVKIFLPIIMKGYR